MLKFNDHADITVQCSFCHQDDTISEAVASDRRFCLQQVDDKYQLKRTHPYGYQVST